MTTESRINKDKPWLSFIFVYSENQQEALVKAGKASNNLSKEWHKNHEPQILPKRNPHEWKKLC